MTDILVLANETIGGKKLLDTVLSRRDEHGDVRFHVVVPLTRPRHGNVIYDEAVAAGAQVRVDLALAFMRENGIEGTGEVGDSDPYNAAMDAIAERHIDEIIVSTLPAAASGWMRRDLPERLREGSGLPVEHVVVDLGQEGLPFDVTLVLANQTAVSPELRERLLALAEEGPHRFIVVVPQDARDGNAAKAASSRLGQLLAALEEQDIVAAGHIGDPDPYTAAMNALQFFRISEVVISTLPGDASRWVAEKLVDRVRDAANVPVEHIESKATAGAEA
jgi:uncharacterized protein YciI